MRKLNNLHLITHLIIVAWGFECRSLHLKSAVINSVSSTLEKVGKEERNKNTGRSIRKEGGNEEDTK